MTTYWAEASNTPILGIAKLFGIEVNSHGKALCFGGHDKQTKSLSFSEDKNEWHCFGCSLGGGPIQLVAHVKGFDNKTAAIWIVNNLSHSFQKFRPTVNNHSISRNFLQSPSDETLNEYKCNPEIYKFLLDNSPLLPSGRSYLNGRGFNDEIINRFKIGQVEIFPHLITKLKTNFGEDALIKCGLLKRDKSVNQLRFAWWDSVIIFPFYENSNLLYLQARRLYKENPKYVNLNKIKIPLFNAELLHNLKPKSRVYICEGIPDTIMACQLGFIAVGVLGASGFKKEWVPDLISFSITVIPDSDAAGQKFYESVQDAFKPFGLSVEKITLPPNTDLTEYSLIKKSIKNQVLREIASILLISCI